MRTILTRRGVLLMCLLSGTASCGDSAPPAPATPTGPTPLQAPILMSARCPKPVHPADTAPAACFVGVEGGVTKPVGASADLRAFGGAAEAPLVACWACGAIEFDLDVRVPADMALGVHRVPVWAIDANGRRADAIALLEVTAR